MIGVRTAKYVCERCMLIGRQKETTSLHCVRRWGQPPANSYLYRHIRHQPIQSATSRYLQRYVCEKVPFFSYALATSWESLVFHCFGSSCCMKFFPSRTASRKRSIFVSSLASLENSLRIVVTREYGWFLVAWAALSLDVASFLGLQRQAFFMHALPMIGSNHIVSLPSFIALCAILEAVEYANFSWTYLVHHCRFQDWSMAAFRLRRRCHRSLRRPTSLQEMVEEIDRLRLTLFCELGSACVWESGDVFDVLRISRYVRLFCCCCCARFSFANEGSSGQNGEVSLLKACFKSAIMFDVTSDNNWRDWVFK